VWPLYYIFNDPSLDSVTASYDAVVSDVLQISHIGTLREIMMKVALDAGHNSTVVTLSGGAKFAPMHIQVTPMGSGTTVFNLVTWNDTGPTLEISLAESGTGGMCMLRVIGVDS
jgi:hypothetical protein